MSTRDSAPIGSPCWTDLWTSDVEGSRRFYSELFGWEAQEANPAFGGYFMFTRNGVPTAGAMGDMGDMPANNSWSIYLATEDIAKTVEAAEAEGAQIISPPMPVADLGIQAILNDPTGAHLGAWQPGTFPGFTVLNEHGAPSWFELFTRDHAAAVAFYHTVFHWDTTDVGDSDDFRYTVMRDRRGEGELAGIMDANASSPRGRARPLVGVLGSRRRHRRRRQGQRLGRLGGRGRRGHALRAHGHRDGPGGRTVQASHRPPIGAPRGGSPSFAYRPEAHGGPVIHADLGARAGGEGPEGVRSRGPPGRYRTASTIETVDAKGDVRLLSELSPRQAGAGDEPENDDPGCGDFGDESLRPRCPPSRAVEPGNDLVGVGRRCHRHRDRGPSDGDVRRWSVGGGLSALG